MNAALPLGVLVTASRAPWVILAATAVAAAVLLARPVRQITARLRAAGRDPALRRPRGSAARAVRSTPLSATPLLSATQAPSTRPARLRVPGIRAGTPEPWSSAPWPLVLDLVAQVLASGAAPVRALAAVAECLDRAGDPAAHDLSALAGYLHSGGSSRQAPPPPTRNPGGATGDAGALLATINLATTTGVGPAALLRATAEEQRRRLHAARIRAAHRLGVLVLLPTGLCLLPAFVLLTVVPMILDLLVR